ncbi:MAG: hypothetical protein U9R42_00210, partial [Bacteroidota bacterium]|nr:hypothetical protein [Bacteroidota bacterium]
MFKLQLLKKHILKVLVTVFFLFNILLLKSQNLVPNPSFEECYSMPTHFLLINNIHKIIKRWNCPVSATPDYFNSRAYRTVSVPNNFIGSQEAKTGNAYVGLILMYANGSEYLQARLKSPLKKDSIYCLSLYISLAEKSSHFVDQV